MAAAAIVMLTVTACGGSSGGQAGSGTANAELAKVLRAELAGKVPASVQRQLEGGGKLATGQPVPGYPKGAPPSPANVFHLSAADRAKLKAGHYTAAIAMHLMNASWPRLQVQAIKATLQNLGVKVIGVTDAKFNASTQINDIQTLLTRHPDVLFSIPVNPTTEASTYKSVQSHGTKLVLLDNVPKGLSPGKDYVTIVSANNGGDARYATEQLVKHVGCTGTVGYLGIGYYFPVVTVRDNNALKVLGRCKNLKLVKQTFTDETNQAHQEAMSMLVAHPDMKGMWAAWDTVAAQVVSAEKAQGMKIFIATSDLGHLSALQMAQGYIQAIGSQQPYAQGVAEAKAAAYSLLGKKVPPFIEVPTVPVTQADLIPAYKKVLHADPPADVINALKQSAGM
ncbi:MAG: substrate-binding domain-containing protein [Sciscionella sp.]